MEGGEEKKRKAGGPIDLDWDSLLPAGTGDDEPPRLVVVKEAISVDDDGEEGPNTVEALRNCTYKELSDKLPVLKRLLVNGSLNDGGEKLRIYVRNIEAELERRKLHLDDGKLKKATSLGCESTCIGATDGKSTGSPTIPSSQSTFASYFCSNLDDERGHGKTKPFDEELSTLNRCRKNMRVNGQFSSQKIGLSSRQAPFKSPSHLSVNISDSQQSNCKQLGSHSSTCFPLHSDRDAPSCSGKKVKEHYLRPRNSRQSNKTVVLVDEEEPEDDVACQAEKVDDSIKDTRIFYPSRDDPEAIEISYSDMKCLAPESFLSSTIMNFYIRYLQKSTSLTETRRRDYQFFNTYFYGKLKKDVLNKVDKETSFVRFRRWWKGVNIFEKAYIFLPIHENLHWSLVIICIPDKEDKLGPVILHLDSLGMHFSRSIFNDVKSFLIEEWKFLRQVELLELPISNKIWDNLSRRIVEKVIEVPQQKNDYDCGLFVLFFMERFIDDAPERVKKKDLEKFGRQWFKPEEASRLRRKLRDLLREEFKNANEDICNLDP